MTEQPGLFAVKPIITYPREAQVGKTYLMTIDLQPEENFEWQYEEEEYPIYCMVESDSFTSKPVGDPVVVLHRFGGSYGEARFLVIAEFEELDGEIKVRLLNRWGVPIKQLVLAGIRVVHTLLDSSRVKNLAETLNLQTKFAEQKREESTEINDLVRDNRERIRPYIKQYCGMMRVLYMEQPIELTGERGIYTTVNVLERITERRRIEITELLEAFGGEEFDRFGLNRITEKRVPGLEAVSHYSKLMVLGRPGAGKTTFLKYLAMQCIEGLFQPDRVPIFITLKDFAETRDKPSLLSYMTRLIDVSILETGRALILLDALDEVRAENTNHVLREIHEFSEQFHTNQFVITCRIAAREYTFEQFTEVEVADFDEEQINSFAQNWFRSSDPIKAERFIQKLAENQPLQELASNPLLLTLLCLVFGELGDFPANRSELYKEGIDMLLKRWDTSRNIMRDEVYRHLSLKRKEDLLSQIAWNQFAHGNYFFTRKTVEQQITDYIRALPSSSSDPDSLHLDSEAILKAIEAQHGLLIERARGIYSFSHLTFQEYFAARHIVETEEFSQLVQHIMENRWQEVFLLVCAMLPRADDLLISIKKHIDQILVENPNLQNYLQWLNTKATSITTKYKSAVIRDLYFVHTLGLSSGLAKLVDDTIPLESILVKYPELSFQYAQPRNEDFGDLSELACDITLTQALLADLPTYIDYSLDYELAIELGLVQRDETNVDRSHIVSCACILTLELVLARASNLYRGNDAEFRHKLEDLRQQLPLSFDAPEQWWANNHPNWVQQLQTVMIEHRNIGYNWQFSDEERKRFQQYYDANNLLFRCLNSDCYVSRKVRQEIEENLLLPHTDYPC